MTMASTAKAVNRHMYTLGGNAMICVMSPSEWSEIPDNPRQRDTERRAEKAAKGHLRVERPVHAMVNAASIDGEIVCKLDGHTRALCWSRRTIPVPAAVYVTVYPVSSIEEAAELYSTFDNADAVETPSDRLFGSNRECGIKMESSLLSNCRYSTAIRLAIGVSGGKKNHDELSAVRGFSKSLCEIDSWGLANRSLNSAAVAMALALLVTGENPNVVRDFFVGIARDGGIKDERGRDGIEAYRHQLSKYTKESRRYGWDGLNAEMSECYSCYLAFKAGRFLSIVRKTSITSLIEKAREAIGFYS